MSGTWLCLIKANKYKWNHVTLLKYVYILYVQLLLFPTPNPPTYTHAITYSCSTHSCSWTAWQRAVLSCYSFHHWYKCWFYIQHLLQTSSKSVGGHPQKLSPADTQYAIHLITSQKAENASERSPKPCKTWPTHPFMWKQYEEHLEALEWRL